MAVVLKGKGLEKEELEETPAEHCFPPSTQTAKFPHGEKVSQGQKRQWSPLQPHCGLLEVTDCS